MAENLANDIFTLLNGAINNVVTAITTDGATGFPAANFRVRIDDELMLVTNVGGGTNWTVTRNIEGTAAASHLDNAPVVHVLTAAGVEQFFQDRGGYSVGVQASIRMNPQTINEDLTIPASVNALTAGPAVTIASGKTVTITTGSTWTIYP